MTRNLINFCSEEVCRVNSDKCSRTFITFTEESTFNEHFPQKRISAPVRQYCAVTRQPAKYMDPVTRLPYSSVASFKALRKTYENYETMSYDI